MAGALAGALLGALAGPAFALKVREASASPSATLSDWFSDISKEFRNAGKSFHHVFLEPNTDDD